MAWVAVAVGGSAILGGILQTNAANSAANTEANAAANANATQQNEFNRVQSNEAPYMQAGQGALSQMQSPAFQQAFTNGDFQTQPGYQFALQQGQNALEASQAARGNEISGSGLAALDQYNVGSADQQYQQAFNNYNTTLNGNYSRLSTLANLGQAANSNQAAVGANAANQIGANTMAGAGAQGAASIYGANAQANTLSGLASAYGYANSPNNPSNPSNPASGGGDQLGQSPGSTPSVYSSGSTMSQPAYDSYNPLAGATY